MTEDEKLVREMWNKAYKYQSLSGREMVQFGPHALADWKEAAEFTRQRLKDIAELDQEIMEVQIGLHGYEGLKFAKPSCEALSRTIKRLEAMRDEKKRGMK